MKNKPEHDHGCLALLSDHTEAVERLMFTAAAASRLANYRDTVNRIERCPGVEQHLAMRARSAENDTRVLLKCALDSLNEIRDSRAIDQLIKGSAKLVDDSGRLDISKICQGAKGFFHENLKEMDVSFLDESEKAVRQFNLDIHLDQERIRTKIRAPEGREHTVTFSPIPQPGDMGRVNTSDFFGRNRAIATLIDSAFADDDCHHYEQHLQSRDSRRVDSYANLIGAFANARDAMARHTRVVEHFGRPHIKAHPVALLIVIGAVAAVTIVAGATLLIGCAAGAWSGDACDWGAGLLGFGVGLGVGLACYIAPGPCIIAIQSIPVAIVGA